MTQRVPKWKCRNCRHFHGQCPLQDLDPCDYIPIDPDKREKDIFLTIVTIIGLVAVAGLILLACNRAKEAEVAPEPEHVSAVALLRELHKNDLAQWDKLILAIAFTESRFNPDALGKNHDSGILQITPVYVDEVNRITDSHYTIQDAFSIGKTLEMYNALQAHYNERRDIEKAIYYHNKSPKYKAEVLKNLELIERYEAVRAELILFHY